MTQYDEQIQRIKSKLLEAKKADKNLKAFGADSHKYDIKHPVTLADVRRFEEKFAISLPDCYKAFVLQVGNGGKGYMNSAAGPYYGIYPLGKNVNELIYDDTEQYLKNDCILRPKMSDDDWKSLTKNTDENDEISDEDYEKELGKLFGGVLPIGSQGCTYLHGIVLNGPHKGRVVNLDMDRQKPQFAFEKNFLDWYERWLDEVISGELLKAGPSWFGYSMGGSDKELMTAFLNAGDEEEQRDCLRGLLTKQKAEESTTRTIEQQLSDNENPFRTSLIQILCKFDYERAKPYVTALVPTDLLSVFQFVYWYAKDKSKEWLPVIEENISRINDEETFRFCTYLLEEARSDYGNLVVPFTTHNHESIRVQAFYSLGKLKNKKSFIDAFVQGLHDDSNRVIHATLQALSGVKDNKLLEHYRRLAEKFPVEQDYILVNLNHRLAEYGLTNLSVLGKNIDADAHSNRNDTQKRWWELWK
ncbi:MAG: SMI1/KNR4 family protein [Cytophagales bacterium]|nr:SMI1/KNR4 family protein [Cytophagales bacterium]